MKDKTNLNLNRDQVAFFVETAIDAAANVIMSRFPARWEDSRDDEGWRKECKDHNKPDDPQEIIQPAIEHLGWTLSILFANIMNDGMGVGDAIDTKLDGENTLDDVLQTFGINLHNGKWGIRPNKAMLGTGTGRHRSVDSKNLPPNG